MTPVLLAAALCATPPPLLPSDEPVPQAEAPAPERGLHGGDLALSVAGLYAAGATT